MTPTAADAAALLDQHGHQQHASAVYRLLAENADLRVAGHSDVPDYKPQAINQVKHPSDAEVIATVRARWGNHSEFPIGKPSIGDVRKIAGGSQDRALRLRDLVRVDHIRRLTEMAKRRSPSS